jgi:hypothetical protein
MELLTEQMLRCTNRDIGTWFLQCKKIFVAVQQKMRGTPCCRWSARQRAAPPGLTFAGAHLR